MVWSRYHLTEKPVLFFLAPSVLTLRLCVKPKLSQLSFSQRRKENREAQSPNRTRAVSEASDLHLFTYSHSRALVDTTLLQHRARQETEKRIRIAAAWPERRGGS